MPTEREVLIKIMNNDPDWDPDLFGGETRLWYGRWDYKYLSAARQSAVGAIILHTTPCAGYPFQVVQTSWTGEQFELPAGDEFVLVYECTGRVIPSGGIPLNVDAVVINVETALNVGLADRRPVTEKFLSIAGAVATMAETPQMEMPLARGTDHSRLNLKYFRETK